MNTWYAFPVLALVGGIAALAPLGSQVLRRGVVFIDLAVAQAAAAAVIWLGVWLHHQDRLTDQVLGTLGALAVALGVAWITRRWAAQREALIGLLYVAGASLSLLGASLDPHGKDRLLELLAADVLWADAPQAATLVACAVAVWALQAAGALGRDTVFYGAFAVVASVAVPTLGLFLVFTCLIAPALWIERGLLQPLAIAGALAAAFAGLALSWGLDMASGPTVALAMTAFGLGSLARTRPKN